MSTQRPDSSFRPATSRLTKAIAIVSGLLLVLFLAQGWVMDSLALRERAQASAGQAAVAVSTYGELLQSHAGALAQVAAAAAGTGAVAVESTFPGVRSAQFLALGPLGIADPSLSHTSLGNNIETRLVGRAFNGENPAPEAFGDNGKWRLVAAARVAPAGGGAARGVVLLRSDLAAVALQHLPPSGEDGEYSLWSQGADGSYRLIAGEQAAARHATEPSFPAATSLRSVYAGFEPASGISARVLAGSLALVIAAAAGALGLMALVLKTFMGLREQLEADTSKLVDLALRQRGATATLPVLFWQELNGLGEALVQLRRDLAQGSARPREPGGEGTRGAPAPPPAQTAKPGLEIPAPAADAPLAVPAEIFRDYDIRGLAAQMPPALAHAIGQSIGSEAMGRACSSIVVGTDGRESSPMLREHLVRGLLSTGIDVIDAGTVATPMLYFACHHLRTMTGVMVTGSHNPADHNGFKVMIAGATLCGDGIQALRRRIEEKAFIDGQGSYRVTEIDTDYVKAVVDDVLVDNAPKIVIDCGNGAASVIAVDLFRELGCDVVPLFCELDSRFPNHHPDPAVPENLRQLVEQVTGNGAALGIAFDGDADRIGVVSASGAIVTADRLMMLFARELLSRHPGADIVFDVKCSRDLPSIIAQYGGRPVMCRSGHSWIKEKMKERGALLGGEFTGHICFRDRWFGFDDALYCAARLLEILTAEERSLDDLLAELPSSVATPEIRIELPEDSKFASMAVLSAGLEFEQARLSRIDGVRAEFADGWGLVRASNTSAALICRFEGRDDASLARIRALFLSELQRLLPAANVSF